MNNSYDIEVAMPEEKSQCYLKNQDEDALTSETFRTRIDNNYNNDSLSFHSEQL